MDVHVNKSTVFLTAFYKDNISSEDIQYTLLYGSVDSKICGSKSFDFKRTTVFCLGHRLSNHKMTRYARNFGEGMVPLNPLATPMVL